jgi:hypothetical protein
VNNKLINLYQEMADLTSPECSTVCKIPHSCCDDMYCGLAKERADELGVEVKPTGHPTLPFMGPNGCTIAPYLRPLCTFHTCAINSMGFKIADPKWTRKYFSLRDKIEKMEYENWKTSHDVSDGTE